MPFSSGVREEDFLGRTQFSFIINSNKCLSVFPMPLSPLLITSCLETSIPYERQEGSLAVDLIRSTSINNILAS